MHNVRMVLADYRILGDELWKRYNKEASKQDHLIYYRQLVKAFQRTAAPSDMVSELDRVVTELERLAT